VAAGLSRKQRRSPRRISDFGSRRVDLGTRDLGPAADLREFEYLDGGGGGSGLLRRGGE